MTPLASNLHNFLFYISVFGQSGTVKLFLVCNDHIVPRNIHNNDDTHIFIQVRG